MGKKKGEIVPFEKHKRVIRLEDRGKERKLEFGGWLFGILGVLCAAYCAGIGLFLGYGTLFFLIWGVLGICFGLISLFCFKPALRRKLPAWFIKFFWICFGIALAIFLMVEGLILSRTNARAKDGADVVIVLGAQWKNNGPSMVLKYRLDAAVHYLRVNREAKVIVSGGKGANEPISEADGMYGYLVAQGISADRIIKEDKSTNTYENLGNSARLLNKEEDKVVIITNDFHLFRAEKLAKAQGYKHVSGWAADSYPPMQIHNLMREFFGVVKDFLMGNLTYWEQG